VALKRTAEDRKQHQQQQQPFYGPLSGTTQVSWYQKKHSPTHHPDHPIFISFFHLPRSIASSLFKLRAWQSFCTTYVHVLFGLPLGLEPSTSYSTHFFTQSLSCFCNTCPYHHNLFYCSISIISSIASLSLSSLPGTPFLWSPYGIWQTIIFSSCRLLFFFFFLLFFPRLISAVAEWMSAILAHTVWP